MKAARFLLLLPTLFPTLAFGPASVATPPPPPEPLYIDQPGSPDGTGKWFLGREIAHFMSHQGAPWLERPERSVEEQPLRLIAALGLKPGQKVADVGAGSGYLSWRLATNVGPSGRVFATDIQPEMIALLRTNMAARRIDNVVPVLSSLSKPAFPPIPST